MTDKYSMERSIREYAHWADCALPGDLRIEYENIASDAEAIYDRFCKDLTFGTSGLRGKMGLGTNRINKLVLKRATAGVMDYLLAASDRPLVLVSYDTRVNSVDFAENVARDLARGGIEVRLFAEPTPVPVLSFAIRELGADGGIMITASHNPREYNGYKVYDHYGNQIDEATARQIERCIAAHDYCEPEEDECEADRAGVVEILSDSIKKAYLRALRRNLLLWTDQKTAARALDDLSVVYTPLNGSGRDYVMEVAKSLGLGIFRIVEEQGLWDGEFPTCIAPNPEYDQVFAIALEKYADADTDIIIATDPDSDRMGVMARDAGGSFRRLSGNQTGLLMLDYVCYCHRQQQEGLRPLSPDMTVFKSYVSSPIAEDIARDYGVSIRNVPTGFKNIAAEMEKLRQQGREEDFLFGFEESMGYLYGTYTRDKDGVLAAQLICLIAAALKSEGKTLFDKLDEMQERYGYLRSQVTAVEFSSEQERQSIDALMEALFAGKLPELKGLKLYADLTQRQSNMFRAELDGGHQLIIRPSGTEPKVKIYVYARGADGSSAEQNAQELAGAAQAFVHRFLQEKRHERLY